MHQGQLAVEKGTSAEGNDGKNDGEGGRITICTRNSSVLDEKIEEIRGERGDNILKGRSHAGKGNQLFW